MEESEICLYRLTVKLLREVPVFCETSSDETLHPVLTAVRHLNGEAHLLKGFVRFSDLGGVLGGEIEPKNRVLPCCGAISAPDIKMRNFSFMTVPTTRRCFYAAGKAVIRPLADFQMAPPDETEAPTVCCGSGFMIPWLFGSGKIPSCE